MSENCISDIGNVRKFVIRTNACFEGLIKDIPNVCMILQCDSVGKLGEKSHKGRKQVIIRAGIDLIGVLNTIWMSSCGQRVQPPLKNWSHTAWAVVMGIFRDVLTDSASLPATPSPAAPFPAALAQWRSGGKVMHNSDDEQNAVSWGWGEGYCWFRVNFCEYERSEKSIIKDSVWSSSTEKSGWFSFECEIDANTLLLPGWKHRSSSSTWQKVQVCLQMWKLNSTLTPITYVALLYI